MPSAFDGKPTASRALRWLPLLVVVLAAIHLYRAPNKAAELEVVPDSVEYAVAGHEFATTGKYQIHVNGRALPPRYPPGFSVLFLAPIYAVAPGNIGNGIFAVWVCGVLAGLFAYLIGNRVAGPWGGMFAAVLFLHHPRLAAYAQVIMTDVPAVALGLIAGWLYLRTSGRGDATARHYILPGVVAALSISIRPLTGLLLIPFLYDIFRKRGRGMWLDLLALVVPCAIAVAMTSYQQWHSFGNWRRTGYQFWLPVPYDYPAFIFSTRNLRDNLAVVAPQLWPALLMGGLGALCLCLRARFARSVSSPAAETPAGRRGERPAAGNLEKASDRLLSQRERHLQTVQSRSLVPLARFIMLAVVPLSLVHLFYFFIDVRFHFLALSLALIVGGAGIAALVPERIRTSRWPALFVLALTILLPPIPDHQLEEGKTIRFEVAMAAAKVLPQNAVLISRVDPAYLEELVARDTHRRILPLDRKTPYSTAVLAIHRIAILNPPPRNAADHACPGLLNGGAEQLYPATADEELGQIAQWVSAGVPVYLDLLSAEADEPSRLAISGRFKLVSSSAQSPWLVRLERRRPGFDS